jgi:hypothetical protein
MRTIFPLILIFLPPTFIRFRNPSRCSRYEQKFGGEGKDSNLRVVLPTAASKLAAALANGDLSACGTTDYKKLSTLVALSRDVLFLHRVDADDREQFAEVVAELDEQSHEDMLPEQKRERKSQGV